MVKIKKIYIKDIKNYIDQEIEISGWLFNLRSSGKILFPIIRDGSGYLETIYLKSSHNQSKFDDLSKKTIVGYALTPSDLVNSWLLFLLFDFEGS